MKLFLLMFFIFPAVALAQVWVAENNWDQTFEDKYTQWVESDNVKKNIFTSKKSPYYGIKVDCADATYALRAIFSYENKLDFKIQNPIRPNRKSRGLGKLYYWGNSLDRWDYIKNDLKRVNAFVNFLGDSLGTETLAYFDTYPVAINNISAGDIFTYKIRQKDGSNLRHAFNIKKVTDIGLLNLIYSNQQRKDDGRPMIYKENFSVKHRPYKDPWWGFKRFKNPNLYQLTSNEYPAEAFYNEEQYAKAKEYGEKKFFKWVQNKLKKTNETPDQAIDRHISSVCQSTKDRIGDINGAINYLVKVKNKCMNFNEFDKYSTPSRDKRLKGVFETFKDDFEFFLDDSPGQISPEKEELAKLILNVNEWDEEQTEILKKVCEIEYEENSPTLHLGQIYKTMLKKTFSSHPNDNIHRRWGVASGKETKCKRYY